MTKLTFSQRRDLASLLEMTVDEDLLADALSDLIAERDNLRQSESLLREGLRLAQEHFPHADGGLRPTLPHPVMDMHLEDVNDNYIFDERCHRCQFDRLLALTPNPGEQKNEIEQEKKHG